MTWGRQLFTLLLRVIPDQLRTDIDRRRELKHLDLLKLVDWTRQQTVWERSEELAAQLSKPEKVMAIRPTRSGEPPTGRMQQPQRPARQPRPPSRRKATASRQPSPRRKVDPLRAQFKGCFHCGALDHARTASRDGKLKGCPEFPNILAEHGGLPKDYKGALERVLEEKGVTRAQSVTSSQHGASGDIERSDYTESDFDPAEADVQDPAGGTIQGCTPFTRDNSNGARASVTVSSLGDPEKLKSANASPKDLDKFGCGDSDADDENDIALLHGWARSVRRASASKQPHTILRQVQQRVTPWTDQELFHLHRLLTAK